MVDTGSAKLTAGLATKTDVGADDKETGMVTQIKLQMDDSLPLRDVVFQTLRQAILGGVLQPGERLMELQLAHQLGVSRTPVREAIRKLEQEGLAQTLPRRGAMVADITRTDLEDVLEVRTALEVLAVQKACRTMTQQQIEKLQDTARAFEQCIEKEDLTAAARTDELFHEIIFNATGNRRLMQLLMNLRSQIYRYRLENLKNPNSRPELIREHQLILDALIRKDETKAEEAVRMHIRKQKEAILEYKKMQG